MEFTCEAEIITYEAERLIAMGFTPRDEKVLKDLFIALKKLGGSIPDKTPMTYPLSPCLLTNEDEIVVVGNQTNGEVEYVIISWDGELYIGVGSDHADKQIETIDIQKSKQLCAKHIGREIWKWQDVKDHWDQIILESYYQVNGKEELYQRNIAKVMLRPETIIETVEEYYGEKITHWNGVIFSGSVPTINGFRYGEHFKYALIDPVRNRKIGSEYSIKGL